MGGAGRSREEEYDEYGRKVDREERNYRGGLDDEYWESDPEDADAYDKWRERRGGLQWCSEF